MMSDLRDRNRDLFANAGGVPEIGQPAAMPLRLGAIGSGARRLGRFSWAARLAFLLSPRLGRHASWGRVPQS